MSPDDAPIVDGAWTAIDALWAGIQSSLPLILVAGIVLIVVAAPLPGRGPGVSAPRDPWRTFKYQPRRTVMNRAAGRCEAPAVLAWGRCDRPAVEADHIYPWSKGGATIVSNGQALCRQHNRRKSNMTPPWWYVLGLERRRRGYLDAEEHARVRAKLTRAERNARRP